MRQARCAVFPDDVRPQLRDAVIEAGARVVPISQAEALIWSSHTRAEELGSILDEFPSIRWVQLPFAGIEPFRAVLDRERVWTCGKGAYTDAVAEHALALALGGFRAIAHYARSQTWSAPVGRKLLGARVCILGGGGIAKSLARLLQPFEPQVTVVRNRVAPMHGVPKVVGVDRLHETLRKLTSCSSLLL